MCGFFQRNPADFDPAYVICPHTRICQQSKVVLARKRRLPVISHRVVANNSRTHGIGAYRIAPHKQQLGLNRLDTFIPIPLASPDCIYAVNHSQVNRPGAHHIRNYSRHTVMPITWYSAINLARNTVR